MEQGKNNAPYTEEEEAEIEKAWEAHKEKIPWHQYTEAHVDFWAGANAAAMVLRKKEEKKLAEMPCPLCQGSGCPVCLPTFTS